MFALEGKKVYVAGHNGMVGAALVRALENHPCTVLTATRQQADLCNQAAVQAWMAANKPDVVLLAAAKVGGIEANNTQPVPFLYDNLMIASNVINAAYQNGVEKLLFLGSSCIYPKHADQPMREEALLTGPLEPTNEWYAIAKIAGIKLCQAYRQHYGADFISAMPTNLYGPGDNFHPTHSHVPAALLRRFHEARQTGAAQVTVWGSGQPKREFMHVDDLADACLFLLQHYSDQQLINIGSGDEWTIADFAKAVQQTIGYTGQLTFDTSKPDGAPRKLMDSSRLAALGWQSRISLEDGLKDYYQWFLQNVVRDEKGKQYA